LHILKHRGPRPLLRMAERLESDLAQQKGVEAHLDYLRKREVLMQYPVFRQWGWPIGSGMLESANKNVVEVRLKGTGMHWERKNVNPLLALRNAVCNNRWKEMWQKALGQHRKLQALHRSEQVKQRVQASLAVCEPSLAASLPAASQEIPSEPVATRSNACRPANRCKHHTKQKRVKHAHQGSGEVRAEVCLCGTPLIRFKGHRTKQYCSDRCRQRAYRKRQVKSSARPCPPQKLKKEAHRERTHQRVSRSPQLGVRGSADVCPCGTPLVREKGHRPREFCSGRCRQRAYRERQAQVS
jgi:endogenous inhibitor of DNA gyrase (YacG/DUF329 family)